MRQIYYVRTFSFLLVFLFSSVIYSQEPVGGPYTTDDNTMLLLHFDGDLNNASSFSANGIGHSNYSGGLQYLPNTSIGPNMGQCLYLPNDAIADSSFVTVPDTSSLDLTGSWTMEGWINVLTFGTGSGDHRWVPRLMIKTGDDAFWMPNYFVELWGDRRFFSTGYYAPSGPLWPQANSPDNTMYPGAWFHLTFMRDTTRNLLLQMVHNASRELISFSTYEYDPETESPPVTTGQPLYIGFAGGGGDSFLDGFVDEIRISNIVRNFAVPPIITDVTDLPNQPVSVTSYEIEANIMPFSPSGSITTADLKYSTDKGANWQTMAMTNTSGSLYSAQIAQLPLGSIVWYYVEATDNNGLTSSIPSDAPDTYLSFAVFQEKSMILNLDFEEGSGVPLDKSQYQNTVINFTPVNFSNDAKFGSWSFYSNYSSSAEDSNWLEVEPYFLASENFCVEAWIKADSLKHAARILNLPIVVTEWNQNNYSLDMRNDASNNPRFGGRYWPVGGPAMIDLLVDSLPQVNVWYHLIFERQDSSAVFQMRDENDNLIQEVRRDDVFALPPVSGGANLRIGRAATQAGNPWFIPPYFGKIDNLKIYNYGALVLTDVNDQSQVPKEFALMPNYPNPFNPSTTIRFTMPNAQKVLVAVYDLLGQKVKTLINDEVHAGENVVIWNGTNEAGVSVSSGTYFYVLKSDTDMKVRKMMLLK